MRAVRITLDASLTVHHPGTLLPALKRMARWKSKAGLVRKVVRLWRWDPEADTLTLPRGLWPLPEAMGPFEVTDHRLTLPEVRFPWQGPQLDQWQRKAATRLYHRQGVLLAPGGTGKTLMGMATIRWWRQPTLWITDTDGLLKQALDDAHRYFRLPESAYGTVRDGQAQPGTHLTVGLRQSLDGIRSPSWYERFGAVFVDEVDLAASNSYLRILSRMRAVRRAGCTATIERADQLHPIVFAMLGRSVSEITEDEAVAAGRFQRVVIEIVRTGRRYDWPGDYPTLQLERARDGDRNWLIGLNVAKDLRQGHNALVLVHRIEHARLMSRTLTAVGVRHRVVTGKVAPDKRDEYYLEARKGGGQCLIATKLINRGVDIPVIDRVHLADSFRAASTVRQQIYRATRTAEDLGKTDAVVYDYWDENPQFMSQAWARLRMYRERRWKVWGL